jgi:hypothetical protein
MPYQIITQRIQAQKLQRNKKCPADCLELLLLGSGLAECLRQENQWLLRLGSGLAECLVLLSSAGVPSKNGSCKINASF